MDTKVIDSLKIDKIGHDIIPVMPKVSVSTPIGSIEADYGNPLVDGTVIVIVLVVLYAVKKIIDRIKINEP